MLHDSVCAQRFRRGWQYGGYDCALTTAKSQYWSTYNSGEDIATTLASSEVDGRPNLGLLVYRFKFITHSSPVQSDLLAMYSHRRKSNLDANVFPGVSFRERVRFFTDRREPSIFFNGKPIRPPKKNSQL